MHRFEQQAILDVQAMAPNLCTSLNDVMQQEQAEIVKPLLTLIEFLSLTPSQIKSNQFVEVNKLMVFFYKK